MELTKNIETPRLLIRSYRKADKAFVLSVWGDRENGKYMSDPAHENMDEKYLACVDGMEDDQEGYYLIAELRENGARVGTCCAFPEKGNYDIGYCIAASHWKKGLGAEMVGALIAWIRAQGGVSVTAEVADDNRASVALLRKFGFTEDRKTRYKKWGEEIWFDAHFYRLVLT